MGQILLAHLPDDELNAYFEDADLKNYTNQTISNKKELLKEFQKIRERGWILVQQQLEAGLNSMAAPIRNSEGKVIAAINISLHAEKTSSDVVEKFAPLLIETAEKIGHDISKSHHANPF